MPGTVLTSEEIAGRIATFAPPVSSFANNPFYGQAAGSALTQFGAMAGPMATGAMGMLGLDPASLGMRAAYSTFMGSGSLVGAAGAGLGMAGAVGLPMMAAGYAGNQMFAGAQQQQQLAGMMRSTMPFMQGNGTQGFNRSQVGQIGGQLRQMAGSMGSGGEMAGFSELTSLLGQMNQQGMSKGVRDAQELGRRFKEYFTTVSQVAKDLNTTLEGASQAVAQLRQNGVFKGKDQTAFTGLSRNMALSGGLAMTEVMGMGSIGAQIARSVGGTGKQGAFAGARAIGQVGTALQNGAISDEDVYNATGLTGAEGRQAFASNMLARDASFLKTGRGRRFLAQFAGKDGNIRDDVVSEFMSGGMTVDRTRQLDQESLGNVGRANFIRNEGRLRGALLERFGGNMNVMALQGWAAGKGVDIDSMNDRSMLFAQRQLGMGRDEFETALKMAKALPETMLAQGGAERSDAYARKVADYRKTHGVEGLKLKFSHAREELNSSLQKAGADIMDSAESTLEKWVNTITGEYTRHVHSGVSAAVEAARHGDMTQFNRLGGRGNIVKSSGVLGSYGMGSDRLQRSAFGAFMGPGAALEKAGYNTSGLDQPGALTAKLSQIKELSSGANMVDEKALRLSSGLKGDLADFFAYQGGKGDNLHQGFAEFLSSKKGSDPAAAALYKQFTSAKGPAAQAAIINSANLASGGGSGEIAKRFGGAEFDALGGGGAWKTPEQRQDVFFKAFMGRDALSTFGGKYVAGAMGGAVDVLSVLSPIGLAARAGMGVKAAWGSGGGFADRLRAFKGGATQSATTANMEAERLGEKDAELKKFLGGDEFSDLARQAFSTNSAERAKFDAKAQSMGRLLQTTGMGATGQMEGIARLAAGKQFAEESLKGPVSEARAKEIASSKGLKLTGSAIAELSRAANGGASIAKTAGEDFRVAAADRIREDALGEQAKMADTGFATLTGGSFSLSSTAKGGYDKLSKTAQAMIDAKLKATKMGVGANADNVGDVAQAQADAYNAMKGMSVEDQKKTAQWLRTQGQGEQAGTLEALAARTKKSQKKVAMKGAVGGIADDLGIGLDKEQSAQIKKLLGEGKEAEAAAMMGSYGGLDQANQDKLAHALLNSKGGKLSEKSAQAINDIKDSDSYKGKKKADAMAAQEAENPLMAAIKKELEEIAKSSKTTSTNTGTMAQDMKGIESFGKEKTK